MHVQAARRSDFSLPFGARRPLALVAALLCAASAATLFTQPDVNLTWTWGETPEMAPAAAVRPAAAPALAAHIRSHLAPQPERLLPAAVTTIVERPTLHHKPTVPQSAPRSVPDDIAPRGAYALHVEANPVPLERGGIGVPMVDYYARPRHRASASSSAVAVPTPLAGPAPVPTPAVVPHRALAYVSLASASTHNYNEFSSGQWRPESYILTGVYALNHPRIAFKLDYREDVYVTNDSFVATSGVHQTEFSTGSGQVAATPVFYARQSTLDARVEVQVAAPHIYVGAGYLHASNNYHYPQLNGVGVGAEKLPDFRPGVNMYGSIFYYPAATATTQKPAPR